MNSLSKNSCEQNPGRQRLLGGPTACITPKYTQAILRKGWASLWHSLPDLSLSMVHLCMHMRTSEDIFQSQPVFHPVWGWVSTVCLSPWVSEVACELPGISPSAFHLAVGLLGWQTCTIAPVFHVGLELKPSHLYSKHFKHGAVFPVQHYPFHYMPCL